MPLEGPASSARGRACIPPEARIGYDHPEDERRFTVTNSGITVVPRAGQV